MYFLFSSCVVESVDNDPSEVFVGTIVYIHDKPLAEEQGYSEGDLIPDWERSCGKAITDKEYNEEYVWN
jgi:hypothetical protein